MSARLVRFLAVTVGIALSIAFCQAGDATFSKDGQRIYQIDWKAEGNAVLEIDLSHQTARSIALPKLAKTDELRGLACDSRGQLLCISKSTLWSFDPAKGALTKVRDLAKGKEFRRIAFNPKLDRTFVTTDDPNGPLFMLGDKSWTAVRMRRHPYPSCLTFTPSGELFFAAYGDLWHGQVDADEGFYSVSAYRYAPLATLETQNTTPAEIGVSDIGVAGQTVYVELARMGGSGDGWFARLARPELKRDADGAIDINYDPKERLPIYQRAIQSVEILGDDSHAGAICVSPDEHRVHYQFQDKHWLVTDGKTEELHLAKP